MNPEVRNKIDENSGYALINMSASPCVATALSRAEEMIKSELLLKDECQKPFLNTFPVNLGSINLLTNLPF